MPRHVGCSRAGRAGAAFILACLTHAAAAEGQGGRQREVVRVGNVTAVAAPADLDLAVALAERADQPADWYGLGRRDLGAIALIVARGDAGFGAVARGRLPPWSAGLALPSARIIAIRADAGDPFQILRHELAHLALHGAIRGRVPLWFDEGYAAVASGEFGRVEALQLNLTVALGRVPPLTVLDAGLRGSHGTAQASYGLAATAVLFLARGHPTRSLAPLLERLADGIPFDSAVAVSTGLNMGRFEEAWQRDVKRRHGVGLWLMAGGMWAIFGAAVIVAAHLRRRRDAHRRAALDVGWHVEPPPQDPDPPPPGSGP